MQPLGILHQSLRLVVDVVVAAADAVVRLLAASRSDSICSPEEPPTGDQFGPLCIWLFRRRRRRFIIVAEKLLSSSRWATFSRREWLPARAGFGQELQQVGGGARFNTMRPRLSRAPIKRFASRRRRQT